MNRASLAALLLMLLVDLPNRAHAADPPPGGAGADPFAPPDETKQPTSTEDEEAAVLGAPNRAQPPQPQPPPPPPRPPAPPRGRRGPQASDEDRASAPPPEKAADQSGIAVELSTSGFASGTLQGGLFMGGRTAAGVIVGGFIDYRLTSLNTTQPNSPEITTSTQTVRLGAGIRLPFVQTSDRRVDLYGAADISFDYKSGDAIATSGTTPTASVSASGFSLAAGPGLRLWVHDQVAIGYVARLRVTHLSGQAGALPEPPTDDPADVSLTQIVFEGTFQLLGVF